MQYCVVKSLAMPNPTQKETTNSYLFKIEDAESIEENSLPKVESSIVSVDATLFHYNLQQSRKQLTDEMYKEVTDNWLQTLQQKTDWTRGKDISSHR